MTTEEGRQLAEEKNLMFFETSAKSGANVKTLFNELAKKLTGIETNPISNTENPDQTKGFSLNEKGQAEGTQEKKPKKKKKWC